jgi:hypothetical protein
MLVVVHEIMYHFVSLYVYFLRCTVGYVRGTSERGSGGTSTPSGITTTVHNPIA